MEGARVRMFFALWPDAAALAATAALARMVATANGGRATAPDKLHLTLVFLGTQPAASLGTIIGAVEGIAIDQFDLVLDEQGFWRKADIAWLGTHVAPAGLIALNDALVRALDAAGIAVDDRPFSPHVTLARRAVTSVTRRLQKAIVWHVDAFSLVASEPASNGSTYRRVAQWPLSAGHQHRA